MFKPESTVALSLCWMKEYSSVCGINIVNGNYNYNANTYKVFKVIYIFTVLYVKKVQV